MRKLEERGVITGYHAVLDAKRLHYDITAFIRVMVDGSLHYPEFVEKAMAIPEVLEVHSITGEGSHILKIRTRNTLSVAGFSAAGAFAAADHFQRNITGGWGQASPGGSYSLSGPASDFWVSDVTYPRGLGYMRVPGRGLGRGALLRQVRATNVELRFSVYMTAPAGDGPYYVYGVARSNGVPSRATTHFSAGWAAFCWGFCLSTVALYHGTFLINSLSHIWGSRRFATPDEVFPTFVIESFPTGLAGLMIAGILAAAMSTVAGSLNSLASATTHDIYAPLAKQQDDVHLMKMGKRFTLMWGVILIGGAILFQFPPWFVIARKNKDYIIECAKRCAPYRITAYATKAPEIMSATPHTKS